MAKKKSSKQKASSPQEFSSSPFKRLKGLSAFAEQKPRSQDIVAKPAKTEVKKQTVSDDQSTFANEMDFLGVKPLSGRDVKKPGSVTSTGAKASPLPKQSREEDEREVFLEAVGSVGKVFKDEWPEDVSAKQAVPRRMKQVERGQLKPEAELDLHGLTIDEACSKARFFLQNAIHQGFQTALIITGKGLHSSDGPVLRQAVEKLLDQQREQVIEWGVAPRRYGGDGALVVFLRRLVAE